MLDIRTALLGTIYGLLLGAASLPFAQVEPSLKVCESDNFERMQHDAMIDCG